MTDRQADRAIWGLIIMLALITVLGILSDETNKNKITTPACAQSQSHRLAWNQGCVDAGLTLQACDEIHARKKARD